MSEDDNTEAQTVVTGENSEIQDDTMERKVSGNLEQNLPNLEQNLPLNPAINPDDSLTDSISAVSKDNSDSAKDANNTESSEGSEASSSAEDSYEKSSVKPLFPMPDLRERDDYSAADFDSEEDGNSDHIDVKISDEARSKSRAEFTTVYDIIDVMEDTLSESKGVLFSPGMVKISREDFEDHLSRLKDMLPVQLERASALMREAERRLRTAQAQANSIVATAQSQSAQLISDAEERAQYLAGQENVTAIARRKAANILEVAQAKSDKLTHGADQYCATVMEGLKQQLDKLEQDVQAGQRVLEERCRGAAHLQDEISAQARLDDSGDDYDERNN